MLRQEHGNDRRQERYQQPNDYPRGRQVSRVVRVSKLLLLLQLSLPTQLRLTVFVRVVACRSRIVELIQNGHVPVPCRYLAWVAEGLDSRRHAPQRRKVP
jgi:hypothetical protein